MEAIISYLCKVATFQKEVTIYIVLKQSIYMYYSALSWDYFKSCTTFYVALHCKVLQSIY